MLSSAQVWFVLLLEESAAALLAGVVCAKLCCPTILQLNALTICTLSVCVCVLSAFRLSATVGVASGSLWPVVAFFAPLLCVMSWFMGHLASSTMLLFFQCFEPFGCSHVGNESVLSVFQHCCQLSTTSFANLASSAIATAIGVCQRIQCHIFFDQCVPMGQLCL